VIVWHVPPREGHPNVGDRMAFRRRAKLKLSSSETNQLLEMEAFMGRSVGFWSSASRRFLRNL
jgi:hypothetical protein